MKNILRRLSRHFFYRVFRHRLEPPWKLLRYYPHIIPPDDIIHQWQQSEWDEYQHWIEHHSINSRKQWLEFHRQTNTWDNFPRISIVTPVYNTKADILKESILSVRMQTSPFWELILVDDGSTHLDTLEVLESNMCADPRIRVLPPKEKQGSGISMASNRGIENTKGDYIIFLDHDDRLAPEAIQEVSKAIAQDSDLDIVYSDRDMISPGGKRFMYLMKPAWSPETLYSGNYIFHLMCYRKNLLQKVGNLRPEYDGSQDYDLILRCMEYHPKVKHISRVLYHWRQHEQSVAMNDEAKSYAFNAGIRALKDAVQRRKIMAKVSEITSLPRGIYQLRLPSPKQETIGLITLKKEMPPDKYRETILASEIIERGKQPYILIHHEDYNEQHPQALEVMASWLQMESVGMVSGCLLDSSGEFAYAGITYDSKGQLLFPYSGYPAEEPGYMAVTKIIRNISGPNPFSVGIRRELWEQLGGFNNRYKGPHALLDFALRALQKNWRIVYNPQAVFRCTTNSLKEPFPEEDVSKFKKNWNQWLCDGDPYYSPNLSRASDCYELNLH